MINIYKDLEKEEKKEIRNNLILLLFGVVIFILSVFLISDFVYAKEYSNDSICKAIYLTEGGAKTNHPYGVMRTYKNTTARQACLNSVSSARLRFVGQGNFIEFLGKTYSPPDINPNWVYLVQYFLNKG